MPVVERIAAAGLPSASLHADLMLLDNQEMIGILGPEGDLDGCSPCYGLDVVRGLRFRVQKKLHLIKEKGMQANRRDLIIGLWRCRSDYRLL